MSQLTDMDRLDRVLHARLVKNAASARYYAKKRAVVIKLLGGVCAVCGGVVGLEVHHKVPLFSSNSAGTSPKRTGAARVREWNAPDAKERLELRCGDHHPRGYRKKEDLK